MIALKRRIALTRRWAGSVGAAVLTLTAVLACSDGAGGGFPVIDGWTQVGDVRVYHADNLWEYIDGAAELFVGYDVQTCTTADLSSGDLVVTIDLYDMGDPLNGFGVFSRERAGERIAVSGATEARVSPPYLALLLKGSTYAKVNVLEGELTEQNARTLLEGLAAQLPGDAALPVELDRLPREGRIAGTEGFQREGYLGLTELTNCVYAEYADGGKAWHGFVALSGWEGLAERWDRLEHGGEEILYTEIPYRGFAGVKRTAEGVLGVGGAADRESLLTRLNAFGR
jgi:hypothetical protein